VKVLDFGLAKALQSTDATDSAVTGIGVMLGTPAYMSPEQAKGRAVDRRADVWAFGAVLYEMLSGRRAFPGENISETLVSVLRQEVDWTAIPLSTPASIRTLLARCLDRMSGAAARHRRSTNHAGRTRGRGRFPATAAFIAAGFIATGNPAGPGRSRRWCTRWIRSVDPQALTVPRGDPTVFHLARRAGALHESQHDCRLARRQPDRVRRGFGTVSSAHVGARSKIIRGTEGYFNLTEPVFSPDGQSIAFHTSGDQTLKRIPVTGGAAVTICRALYPYSVDWGPDGILFIEPDALDRPPISRQHSCVGNGGTPQRLVSFKNGEMPHGTAHSARRAHLLFTLATGGTPDRWDRARIVFNRSNPESAARLIEGGSDARFVPTGHLVYALGGSLFAVAFDVQRLAVSGHPVRWWRVSAGQRRTLRAAPNSASPGTLQPLDRDAESAT